MKPKLLLLGYSGHGNFGDDLLLKLAYDHLKDIADLTIHTTNTKSHSDYLIQWFPKAEIYKSIKLTYSYLKRYSHVLYFGGGVFFDYRVHTLKSYLRKKISVFKIFQRAKLAGCRIAGIGIGIGPFNSKLGEQICIDHLNTFDFLNVRDDNSYSFAQKAKKIRSLSKSNDLSLSCYSYFKSILNNSRVEREVLICPRHYPHGNDKNSYLNSLLMTCSNLSAENFKIRVLGFQANHDEPVLETFSKEGYETNIWDPNKMSLEDVVALFSKSFGVITARMHGIFIAGMVNTPFIAIGVHPKLKYATSLFDKGICIENKTGSKAFENLFSSIENKSNNFNKLSFIESQCNKVYVNVINWINT